MSEVRLYATRGTRFDRMYVMVSWGRGHGSWVRDTYQQERAASEG